MYAHRYIRGNTHTYIHTYIHTQVVVRGGANTVKTISEALDSGVPVVLVKGSGGAADLLSDLWERIYGGGPELSSSTYMFLVVCTCMLSVRMCMYVCVHYKRLKHVHASTYVHFCFNVYVCLYTYIYIYIYIYKCMYVCSIICIHTCIFSGIHRAGSSDWAKRFCVKKMHAFLHTYIFSRIHTAEHSDWATSRELVTQNLLKKHKSLYEAFVAIDMNK